VPPLGDSGGRRVGRESSGRGLTYTKVNQAAD